jgi:hypothetical protein
VEEEDWNLSFFLVLVLVLVWCGSADRWLSLCGAGRSHGASSEQSLRGSEEEAAAARLPMVGQGVGGTQAFIVITASLCSLSSGHLLLFVLRIVPSSGAKHHPWILPYDKVEGTVTVTGIGDGN